MSLNVRRGSDPSLADLPPGEALVGQDEPSRKNPTHWSTTAGFQKYNNKPNPRGATSTLEQQVTMLRLALTAKPRRTRTASNVAAYLDVDFASVLYNRHLLVCFDLVLYFSTTLLTAVHQMF